MPKPFDWNHTECPPASQFEVLFESAVNGAMNRALMSGGAILYVVDLDRSTNCCGLEEYAQSLVTYIVSTTYSCTTLQPSVGSTSTSPPSPPKFELIFGAPTRRIEPPLSCRPPLTIAPLPG